MDLCIRLRREFNCFIGATMNGMQIVDTDVLIRALKLTNDTNDEYLFIKNKIRL